MNDCVDYIFVKNHQMHPLNIINKTKFLPSDNWLASNTTRSNTQEISVRICFKLTSVTFLLNSSSMFLIGRILSLDVTLLLSHMIFILENIVNKVLSLVLSDIFAVRKPVCMLYPGVILSLPAIQRPTTLETCHFVV